jgi:hypothetical protein
MTEHSVAYVALDTSKLHNATATAEAGREVEIRFFGEIDATREAGVQAAAKSLSGNIMRRGLPF